MGHINEAAEAAREIINGPLSRLHALEIPLYPDHNSCRKKGEEGKELFFKYDWPRILLEWLQQRSGFDLLHVFDGCH
jgi:hypothetical protein